MPVSGSDGLIERLTTLPLCKPNPLNWNEFLSVLPLIIVLIVFYTILWVPQRRRNKRHTKMIDDLKIGNNVVTDSGIYGRIVSLDDNTVTLVLKKGELVVSKNKIDGLT